MIPYKLRLHNFMCYRNEQALDFSGIHLACLAGENGHGKSALLDAMTWALWGRARTRRDDDLITQGESEMAVELEFGLNNQRYRVLRQRSKKGRGQSDLHLYIRDGDEDGAWRLLDEGTLNERQQQIIRLLRLDYETFTNSAFLLQGRADSFTTKTPAERKQVLAEILGVSRYDLYEARAKELAQGAKEQALRVDGELRSIEEDLARRATFEAELAAARATVTGAAEQLSAADKEHGEARLALQELRGQSQQLNDLNRTIARAEQDLADVRQQLADAQTRLKEYEGVLARREEIEAGWHALEAARHMDADWNERLRKGQQLLAKQTSVQRAIDLARAQLEAEQRRFAQRHAELARQVATLPDHQARLAEAQAALQHYTELEERRAAILIELRGLGDEAAAVKAEVDRVTQEGKSVKFKADVLQTSDAATCPLCEQPLTPEHRDRMEAALRAEHKTLTDQFIAWNARIKVLGEQKTALERDDRALAIELKGREDQHKALAAAESAIAEAKRAAIEQAAASTELEQLNTRLAQEDFEPAARAEAQMIAAEIAAVGYDATEHTRVGREIKRLSAYDAQYQRQLLPALDGVSELQVRVTSLGGQIARRQQDLAEDEARRTALTAEVAALPAQEVRLRRARAELERVAEVERRARQREGGAMQQLAALDALGDRREALRSRLDAFNAEQSLYSELREAFGKKGIQAMIIESAIPEVETEANLLLNRMSEGRMSVRLETQREKVTGGVAETLDILVSDELGSRPYETFSGGECFRTNLALRIAISKLLARRAGAQLQTLVIDEGFGSQDATGRNLVVEAINSIQHDFERILVITHIEELKDQFPARIDVVKTRTGSQVNIA